MRGEGSTPSGEGSRGSSPLLTRVLRCFCSLEITSVNSILSPTETEVGGADTRTPEPQTCRDPPPVPVPAAAPQLHGRGADWPFPPSWAPRLPTPAQKAVPTGRVFTGPLRTTPPTFEVDPHGGGRVFQGLSKPVSSTMCVWKEGRGAVPGPWGPIQLRHLVLHFLQTQAHLPHGAVRAGSPHNLTISPSSSTTQTLITPVPLVTAPGSRRKGLICISSPSPNLSVCTVVIATGPKRLYFAVTSPSVLLQC